MKKEKPYGELQSDRGDESKGAAWARP